MMPRSEFLNMLRDAGVEFISGVPDTLLNDLCLALEAEWHRAGHVIAANEGNAIAIAAGHHLATGLVPLVYMQNSGLGNALNPLASLADVDVYAIPLVLLIGWRGHPDRSDWPQHHRQGIITPRLLAELGVPYHEVGPASSDVGSAVQWAVRTAESRSGPAAILVAPGVFDLTDKPDFSDHDDRSSISREQAIAAVLDVAPSDALFVATTGRASRELRALRMTRGEDTHHDFLNVGAMGHASSIAAGLALGQPQHPVICFDGDAALLMHMGALATNASLRLENLIHIVLNNGAHESVGGQPALGQRINLTSIASAAGFSSVVGPIATTEELHRGVVASLNGGGPAFIDMWIRPGMRSDMPKLLFNPSDAKALMRGYLQ